MRTICWSLWVLLLFAATTAVAAELENARARQQGNRGVITYDLVAEGPAPVRVKASDDGGRTWGVKLDHLSGDVGDAVAPGRGKTITWDALRDYPRGVSIEALVFELSTSGGDYTDPVTGMEFVCIDGGAFQMGDTFGDGYSNEKPVHQVTVSDYCIGKYEVTQAQWRQVMGSNPSRSKGDDRPVEQVSWNDAQEFIEKLNRKTGKKFRLPTEAEWEYAARSGGKKEKWAGTSSEGQLGDYAWYDKNSGGRTHPVGQKEPNGLGLYDMSGNVWEWVQDWYGKYYRNSPGQNPSGPSSGQLRVFRGGGWSGGAGRARAALRGNSGAPGLRLTDLGFRLATVR